MRIFYKKAVKSPQRRPRTPVGLRWLGAPSPEPRVVTPAY